MVGLVFFMSAADALLRRRLAMLSGMADPMAQDAGGGALPAGPMSQNQNPPSPLMPNPQLEQQAQAQGFQDPMNPIIAAIQKKLGLMNLVRNRANTQGVDQFQ